MRNERPFCSLRLIVDLSFTSIEICVLHFGVQHRNILATKGFLCVLIALIVEWDENIFLFNDRCYFTQSYYVPSHSTRVACSLEVSSVMMCVR
jgi:hypothetical protein